MKRLLFTLFIGGVFLTGTAFAQDGTNQISYLNLAQQFSTSNTSGDAGAIILPSVALGNSYGSFIDNPASVAMISTSSFNFGYFRNSSSIDNSYLGSTNTVDDQNGRLGNIGILYSHPTTQGSLVFGGGYNLINNTTRNNFIATQNDASTITDAFANPLSAYNGLAFDTFAIDFYDVTGTDASIWRIFDGAPDYFGIYQTAEIVQTSRIGEFSFFGATEFAKNLFVGASVSIVGGDYSYRRNFIETDLNNVYNSDFLFQDENGLNGTDLDEIFVYDEIDADILGSTIRAGLVYKALPFLNVGASYVFPTRLYVTETYLSSVQTFFDDNSQTDEYYFDGEFDYEIRKPSQLNLGLALEDIAGFTVSGSVELIDYTSTEVDLTVDPNLDRDSRSDLLFEEAFIDSTINADYNLVANLKLGAQYAFINGFEIRAGAQILPGKSDLSDADQFVLSGGIGLPLAEDIFLDLSTTYTQWDDFSVLYQSTDLDGNGFTGAVNESISDWNVLIGLRFSF